MVLQRFPFFALCLITYFLKIYENWEAIVVKSTGTKRSQNRGPPYMSLVALGKSFDCSNPQSPHQSNGVKNLCHSAMRIK